MSVFGQRVESLDDIEVYSLKLGEFTFLISSNYLGQNLVEPVKNSIES